MEGWFAVKHGIRKHPIFRGRTDRLGAWVAMLDEAAFADTKQDVSGTVVDVKRGELCASQAMLEEITGLPRQQLRTFLTALEKSGAITTRPATNSTKSRTIVTFCNYDKYQTAQPKANQEPTKDQPTKEQDNNIPVGEGAEAPSEPIEYSVHSKAVWSAGKPYLTSKGVNKAGSLIGMWLKTYEHRDVLDAISMAQKAGTEDPVPYITQVLSKPSPRPTYRKGQPEKMSHVQWMKQAGRLGQQ